MKHPQGDREKRAAGYVLNVSSKTLMLAFMAAFALSAQAQFHNFIRVVPQKDSTGATLPGANTTFADGTTFQPSANSARSTKWTYRTPYGDGGVLSSLGPTTTTYPAETKELVTTVSGLKAGAQYSVKALFWTPDDAFWGLRAGLTYAYGTRTNTWYGYTNTVKASLLAWDGYTSPSIFRESGRELMAAFLGTASASGVGQIKVYVQDLPATNADLRTWYQGVAVSEITDQKPCIVDISADGKRFARGVRGLALADVSIDRGEYAVGIPRTLQVARGSAIRGVATGLAADCYDWRTRNGQARPSTLHFLRYSRDYQAELWLGANIRGLIRPDPAGGFLFYDTNTTSLATMAAEWVRYVNHIVPTYRQGDAVTDARDAAILDSLTWNSSFPGDHFDKLLAPGEAAVPLTKYWEIGNEPTIGVSAFSVNNSFTMDAANFKTRYGAVAKAIKAENPNVKVGPTLVHGGREAEHLAAVAADVTMPLDFITYHPYERMGELTDPALITLHLGSVYSHQLFFYRELRKILSDNGRNPDALEYATTEVNVSSWDTNDSDKEARIAHALGTVETVFTHARLGLVASHYWIWPTHRWDGTEYPVFKAYEKLRDHMGDTMVSNYAHGNIRVYTTRDSRTGKLAVWGLNFSNDQNSTVDLRLEELPRIHKATLLCLQDKSGITTLNSLNSSTEMPGGRVMNVDWTTLNVSGTDLANYHFHLPAATLSVLVLEPGLEAITTVIKEQNGGEQILITFPPLRNASEVRYRVLRSEDLKTWTVAEEVEANGAGWISIPQEIPPFGSTQSYYRIEGVTN